MGKVTGKYLVRWTATIAVAVVLLMLLPSLSLAVAPISITAPGSAVKDGDVCHTAYSAGVYTNIVVELSFDGGTNWEAPPVYEGLAASAPSPLTWTVPISFATSTHCKLKITCDSGGAPVTAESGEFTIDNTPPQFTSVPSADHVGWTNSGIIQISWAASDAPTSDGLTSEYRIDSSDNTDYTPNDSPLSLDVAGLGLSDGKHTVDIRVTDAAGNATTKSVDIYLDKTPPNAFDATPSTTNWTKNNVNVTFATTDFAPGAGMDHYAVSVDGGAFTTQASPFAMTLEGVHTLSVEAFDAAGNVRLANASVTTKIDKTVPSMSCSCDLNTSAGPVPITYEAVDPNGANGSGVKLISLWFKKGSAGSWMSTGLTSTSASGTFNFNGLTGEDTYYFGFVVIDNAGNVTASNNGDGLGQTVYSLSLPTFDSIACTPHYAKLGTEVTITFTASKPLGDDPYVSVNDSDATLVSSSGLNYTFKYTVQPGDYEGPADIYVEGIDTQSNYNWADDYTQLQIDTSAPEDFTPTASPASWTNAGTVQVSFDTIDLFTAVDYYEVAIDSGAFSNDVSPYNVDTSTLADGIHVVHIKAVDMAGNELVKDVSIYVDKTAPDAFAPVANPTDWTNASNVTISFGSHDGVLGYRAGYLVSMDGAAASKQSSPYVLDVSSASDGTHTVSVSGEDNAGNSRAGTVQIRLDKTPPHIVAASANGYSVVSPIPVSYTVSDASSGVKRVALWVKKGSGGTWTDSGLASTTAAGSFNFTGMTGDAAYYFGLVVTDNAGNTSGAVSGDGVTSTVFDTAPLTFDSITATPHYAKSGTVATITFAASKALADDPYVSVNDNDATLVSSSGLNYTFSYTVQAGDDEGPADIYIEGFDLGENYTWTDNYTQLTIDKTAPVDFTPTANPSSWTSAANASISFSTTDASAGMGHYEVAVDGGTYATQTSPYSLSIIGLSDGTHTVHVKAIDLAGNERDKDVTIRVDKQAPLAFVPVSTPAAWTGLTTAQITWSTSDAASGVDHYQVALDGGAYSTQTSPYTMNVAGLAVGTHVVHVKAFDAAGNSIIGDVSAQIVSSTTPPTASLSFSDPSPSLGRQFDYVFWKNWMGVKTAAQNTYNVNWTASAIKSTLTNVYIEYRSSDSADWSLLKSATTGTGTVAFDVSARPESDSYQFRIRVVDSAGGSTTVNYGKFGVYDATKLVPTAQIVTPLDGTSLSAGSTIKAQVQVDLPVFNDPRAPGKAYKDSTKDWWFSSHTIKATPKLQSYKKKGDVPSKLIGTLLASIPRGVPQSLTNTNLGQAGQYLGYVIVNTWSTNYTINKNSVDKTCVCQLEMKYSDVVTIGNMRQADKPNKPGQKLPSTSTEPLIGTLKQCEYARYFVK